MQWQIQGEGRDHLDPPIRPKDFFAFTIIHRKTISRIHQNVLSEPEFQNLPPKHSQLEPPSHAYPKHIYMYAMWKALCTF